MKRILRYLNAVPSLCQVRWTSLLCAAIIGDSTFKKSTTVIGGGVLLQHLGRAEPQGRGGGWGGCSRAWF